jgi:rSAM/selenodomain-associated transferase 2
VANVNGAPRLSVIVPARNEASGIAAVLERIAAGRPDELLVVDGRSEDDTAAIALACGATVISSDIGRGRQVTAGMAAATGDIVLLVHADTLLPTDYRQQISAVLQQGGVALGAFRLRIDAPGAGFRLIEWAVLCRCALLRLPYGDQALFLPRPVMRQIDHLADFDVMEDVELVRQARRLGRIVIAGASVTTSARRWMDQGLLRATLINQVSLLAYWARVSPGRIAAWRRNMARQERARTMPSSSTGNLEHDQQHER